VPRKPVSQELSRERILEAAHEMFSTHGFRNLTMRSIAKAMGYSHGALYYHFHDKAELFYALVREDFLLLLDMQRKLLADTVLGDIAHLERMMFGFIRFGLEHPHHYEIMFTISDPELIWYSRTEKAQCLDLFASVVHSVIGTSNKTADLYKVTWSLFMSLHGFICYNIRYAQAFRDVETFAQEHVRQLCRGII
jgi:AcrR family transcriptional regulator